MTAAEQPAGALRDAESEAWEALWETDAARCCSCPSCNYYALDYEAHKDEPCLLQTLVERILAARLAAVPAAVDERAGGEVLDVLALFTADYRRAAAALADAGLLAAPPTQERPGD